MSEKAPTPWGAVMMYPGASNYRWWKILDDNGNSIADHIPDQETAQKMAAADDLLEALKWATSRLHLDNGMTLKEQATTAKRLDAEIQKAEGTET